MGKINPRFLPSIQSMSVEDVEDIVGNLAVDSSSVDFNYDDAKGKLSASIITPPGTVRGYQFFSNETQVTTTLQAFTPAYQFQVATSSGKYRIGIQFSWINNSTKRASFRVTIDGQSFGPIFENLSQTQCYWTQPADLSDGVHEISLCAASVNNGTTITLERCYLEVLSV